MSERFKGFEEFWPYYLEQHRHPVSRACHLAGTTLALLCIGLALTTSPAWALAAPLGGYGLAWLGHFAFEHNRPATFRHPLWSLRADFRMFRLMLTGRLGP
ncbi:hypothetical protein D3C86_355280 [compost metagenome]